MKNIIYSIIFIFLSFFLNYHGHTTAIDYIPTTGYSPYYTLKNNGTEIEDIDTKAKLHDKIKQPIVYDPVKQKNSSSIGNQAAITLRVYSATAKTFEKGGATLAAGSVLKITLTLGKDGIANYTDTINLPTGYTTTSGGVLTSITIKEILYDKAVKISTALSVATTATTSSSQAALITEIDRLRLVAWEGLRATAATKVAGIDLLISIRSRKEAAAILLAAP